MAHQTHNVPWTTLASNFTFFENIHITPRVTDFFPLNLPTQPKSLTYFVQRLSSIIQEFSKTERAKYPATFKAPTKGKLFTDELRDKWPYSRPGYPGFQNEVLSEKIQNIEYWITRVNDKESRKYSWDGDMEEIVKMLLHGGKEEMETLLMLAHHPQLSIGRYRRLSCGNSYGWDQVAECALEPYIFFNTLVAYQASNPRPKRSWVGGGYKEMKSYRYMSERITAHWNHDAHAIPHREFLWETGPNAKGVQVVGGCGARLGETLEREDVFADHARLRAYVKELFRLIVRYDVLAREVGVETDWEAVVGEALSYLWRPNWEYEWDKETGWTGKGRFV